MKFKRLAFALTALLPLIFAAPAGAVSAPMWQVAKIAVLPAGATGLPSGFLPALSCPSSGNCGAGGAYEDSAANTEGLVLNEVKGTWKKAVRLIAPTGASSDPLLTVDSISCGSNSNCVATGNYADKAGDSLSFVATEVRGVWAKSREIKLPSNALGTGQVSEIHSISCTSAGNCGAIGVYKDNTSPIGLTQAFVVSEVHGVWSKSSEVTLPVDANVDPFTTLNQITCASTGNCVAAGSYIDTQDTTHALVVNEVRGTWLVGQSVTLPGDANAYPVAALSEVTCAAVNNCTGLGTYVNTADDVVGLTVTELRGVWQRAVAIVMPTGAATNPSTFFYGFGGLSCPSIGNCSAGGQFLGGASANAYEGFFVNEVHGTWQQAVQLGLPSGAQSAGRNGGVVAVSCRSAGNCSAGAAYIDAAGNYQALVVNEVSSHWLTGTKISLPTGGTQVGVDGGVYGLVCHAKGPCTATGSYLRGLSTYEGFTVTTK
jgi:hypothetical protein